jgi:transcriptional regulator with XRE-family HTH domain
VEEPEEVIKQVGLRIAELREKAGLTQAEVAETLGMTVTNYQRIEHGFQNFTAKTLVRVAGAVGVPVAMLFEPGRKLRSSRGRPAKRNR